MPVTEIVVIMTTARSLWELATLHSSKKKKNLPSSSYRIFFNIFRTRRRVPHRGAAHWRRWTTPGLHGRGSTPVRPEKGDFIVLGLVKVLHFNLNPWFILNLFIYALFFVEDDLEWTQLHRLYWQPRSQKLILGSGWGYFWRSALSDWRKKLALDSEPASGQG